MKNARKTRTSPNKRFQKPRETIGFRPSVELRKKIEASAEQASHSLATEVALRLQQAYADRDGIRRSLVAAFGDYETMAVIFTLARAANAVSEKRRTHWLGDVAAFEATKKAFELILLRLGPTSAAPVAKAIAHAGKAWDEYAKSDTFRNAGESAARELLSIIETSEAADWWPFGLPHLRHTKEFQADFVERDELLFVLRRLLEPDRK